jgi:hypothetical protein
MSIKLTDTQLVMLSAAARREDRCISAPPSVRGAAAQKVATKLIAAGLCEEIGAEGDAPIWRRDAANGQGYALKLTPAGMRVIGIKEAEVPELAADSFSPPASEVSKETIGDEVGAGDIAPPAAIAAPREGSKLAAVVAFLRRDSGVTVDELASAMGWLPHTTRAALTDLRRRGFGIDRRKTKDERVSAYLIVDGANAVQR